MIVLRPTSPGWGWDFRTQGGVANAGWGKFSQGGVITLFRTMLLQIYPFFVLDAGVQGGITSNQAPISEPPPLSKR